ncbi:MAG: hypothetical protein WCB04_07075 [Mycobacteriales bacterium]
MMVDDPTAEQPGSTAATGNDPGDQSTGEPRVDAAIAGLHDVDALPVAEHVETYADVHARLQEILNEIGSPDSAVD